MTVEVVAHIKVKSAKESILTAPEVFTKTDQERESLMRSVMEGDLRAVIGQLTVEEIVKLPEMVGDRTSGTYVDEMNKIGLEVISSTIEDHYCLSDYRLPWEPRWARPSRRAFAFGSKNETRRTEEGSVWLI